MEARQPFSRLGWALFAQMAVMLAAQWGVLLLARAARPGLLGEPVFLWAASVLGAYGLGIPAACLVLRGTAAPPAPARRPLGPVRFAALWAGSVGLAYLANGATLLLTGLLGRLRGAAVVNPVESIGPKADQAEQARRVFDALRAFDGTEAEQIWAQGPEPSGIGLAVANRLNKAAGFHIVEA